MDLDNFYSAIILLTNAFDALKDEFENEEDFNKFKKITSSEADSLFLRLLNSANISKETKFHRDVYINAIKYIEDSSFAKICDSKN
jgi:hypothetical protein